MNYLKSWNVSQSLKNSKAKAIKTSTGWEITQRGREHLKFIGFDSNCQPIDSTVYDLREKLAEIADKDTHAFVEEAIRCAENRLLRSAVVMSWLVAVHVSRVDVVTNHLDAFNDEVRRRNGKWRQASTADDFSLMKEDTFLECLVAVRVISRDVKKY